MSPARHVFESVFRKYDHHHNCVPRPRRYEIAVGDRRFGIPGVLFCQQNTMNKACAHVALRTLLSRFLPTGDISYEEINRIALGHAAADWEPSHGLDVAQIRAVLNEYKIGFRDIDYAQFPDLVESAPFQKFVYAGVESGLGALLGFELSGPALQESRRHIIPFYGHTFNQDTWAPDADSAYFHIGEGLGYIPSENWTSSFLGHDDNFGPNYCVPRLYVRPEQVRYVVELFQPGVQYSGVTAEALALAFLYSVIPQVDPRGNRWLERLRLWASNQKAVLRAQALNKREYINHLRNLRDWEDHSEQAGFYDLLQDRLPEMLWMIEVSTPQLFPANERKLGEIILDAGRILGSDSKLIPFDMFLFARFPSLYFFGRDIDQAGRPRFTTTPSTLISHTSLYIG